MTWVLLVSVLLWQSTHFTWAQFQYDCPAPWLVYDDECYKFELYEEDLQAAKEACSFDGASLVSIDSRAEFDFISSWLDQNDVQNNEWYTSGIRDTEDESKWFWEGQGTTIEGYQFWLNEDARQREGDRMLMGTDGATWGWVVGSSTIQDTPVKRPFICEISRAEVYKILEEDRGFEYGTDETDPIMYQRGPHYIRQPEDVLYDIIGVDNFAIIECVASANPPAEYQWLLTKEQKTAAISPLQHNRYTITNGKLTVHDPEDVQDNGDYQCVAGNKFGSILSNTVQLGFGYLLDFPKSKRDPVRVEAYAGIGIECNPPNHGYPFLLYSWYKNNYMNFIRPKLKPYIFVSANGKLYFSSVTKDDIGDYHCIVSSPYTRRTFSEGKISMPISLRVHEAVASVREPEIASGFPTVFPSSPKQGDNISIECFAWGTDELDYNWQRIGGPMPSSAMMTDHNRVLVIPDVQLMHAGLYECSVTRLNGLRDVKRVSIPIESEPFFTIPLKNQHVDKAADLTWHCIANGIPTVSYKWYRNATRLKVEDLPSADQARYTINSGVLTIKAVDPVRDSGMYQCAATNSHNTVYSSAQLRVLSFAPNFNKYPLLARQYGTLNGNVTVLCRAEAAPGADKMWVKDGRNLDPGANGRISILPNGNLHITKVKTTDAGTYTCKASNEFGTASSTGNLTILSTTTISQIPRDLVVQVNRTAFFDCEASFNPVLDITYDWYQNHYKIEFIRIKTLGQDKIYIEREDHFKRGAGINRGGLYIVKVGFEHGGEYTCIAKTTSDSIKRTAKLIVIGPPSPPAGVYGEATTAHTIIIKWGTAGNNGREITSYTVEGWNEAEAVWKRVKTNVRGDELRERQTKIEGLKPFSSYKFRVRAENVLGLGEPSDDSPLYTTMQAKPKVVPQNIGGGGGKVGDLTITWDPVSRFEQNGEQFGYIVSWKKRYMIDEEWTTKKLMGADHIRHVALVGSNNFYTEYDVQVQAFNQIGLGPAPEDAIPIFSAEDIPIGVPTNVRAAQHNATALYAEWVPVPDTRENLKGILKGYRINYWKEDTEDEEMSIYRVVIGQMDGALIIGLDPYTSYIINVQAINTAGNGPKSQDFIQRTLRSPPMYAPTEVQVDVAGYNSINVKWRGVSTGIDEEPLEGYMVRIWRVGENVYVAKDYDGWKKSYLRVEDLEMDTLYNLRVYGYSRGGQGLMSSPGQQFILGTDCWVKEDIPDKDYVYKCRGETDGSPGQHTGSVALLALTMLLYILSVRANL